MKKLLLVLVLLAGCKQLVMDCGPITHREKVPADVHLYGGPAWVIKTDQCGFGTKKPFIGCGTIKVYQKHGQAWADFCGEKVMLGGKP